MSKESQNANRLVHEKSPYLLQHAYNPVDWYPWGDEAFSKAKEEDKPIFLSIGYSTCHWCHVMEHESFEDEEVANLMNENFVCIKVDREERPDIDKVYMEVAQLMTGRGGWPLTIIMTPDKRPFIAATYISKDDKYGQRGMLSLIPIIHNLWTLEREKVDLTVEQVHEALTTTSSTGKGDLGIETIEAAFSQYSQRFDEKLGGFGGAPKFPSPHNLLLILRYWKRTGDDWALHMVEKTLQEMRKGGIFDHIGYGFHRYSTDSKWLLPHFEKMLYDQAMLMLAYAEAFQATRKDEYAQVVHEIAEYLFRDMKHERGAFYSAEDADSEGVEGKFYVWSMDEIETILTEHEVEIVSKVFNISDNGNFQEEATEETGLNIPHLTMSLENLASSFEIELEDFKTEFENIRKKLFSVREKRVRPHLDDKILTDWNGLMIAALAKAARILDDADLLEAAKASVAFILKEMIDSDGNLYHRFREDEVRIRGFLDDYAFLAWALIELYESTFDIAYLQRAKSINSEMIQRFWDTEEGGFFFTASDSEELLVKKKEAYDGAIPSGNSIATLVQVRLARLLGDSHLEDRATQILSTFSTIIEGLLTGFSMMLVALDFVLGPSYEVVIVGELNQDDTRVMIDALWHHYMPSMVVILKHEKNSDSISELAPFARYYDRINEKATAHVCKNHNCQLPTNDIEHMLSLLQIES